MRVLTVRHPKATLALFAVCALIMSCAGTTRGKAYPGPGVPEIKKNCALCHATHGSKTIPLVKKPITELCAECHPGRKAPAEHRVDITPSMKVKGLPLQDGKMTCVTCHDPHSNQFGKLLRRKTMELCQVCHNY